MSTLSIKQLLEERRALDGWLDNCEWAERHMKYQKSEFEREKYAQSLESLKKNYHFRFCRPETDVIKETIETTFSEARSIDPKLRLKSARPYVDHSSKDYQRERVITRHGGFFQRDKLLVILQEKSFFRNRYYAHLGFYPESKLETTVDLPKLFVRNLSTTINQLNEKRQAFEDEHQYDYEHEDRWLFVQRVVMYDSENISFEDMGSHSQKLLILVEDV